MKVAGKVVDGNAVNNVRLPKRTRPALKKKKKSSNDSERLNLMMHSRATGYNDHQKVSAYPATLAIGLARWALAMWSGTSAPGTCQCGSNTIREWQGASITSLLILRMSE